jgi:hypothetical protein
MAGRAHGVVTRVELLTAGLTPEQIRQRTTRGALRVVHRGVYRVGHTAPSVEARYLAAVLACGEGAVLSGRAAAHLWGLLKGPAPPLEVTAPTERRVKGVKTRRARRAKRETTTWRGIPVTTPARTLVDLAAVVDAADLARACHEAGRGRSGAPPECAGGGAAAGGPARGSARDPEQAREPVPRLLARGRRVDCRWSEQRLTVELDSYRYHHTRHAWERDRRREREAFARGDEFRRYTYADVTEDPRLMLRELRVLLHV